MLVTEDTEDTEDICKHKDLKTQAELCLGGIMPHLGKKKRVKFCLSLRGSRDP